MVCGSGGGSGGVGGSDDSRGQCYGGGGRGRGQSRDGNLRCQWWCPAGMTDPGMDEGHDSLGEVATLPRYLYNKPKTRAEQDMRNPNTGLEL